jgi:hypothetical protein
MICVFCKPDVPPHRGAYRHCALCGEDVGLCFPCGGLDVYDLLPGALEIHAATAHVPRVLPPLEPRALPPIEPGDHDHGAGS